MVSLTNLMNSLSDTVHFRLPLNIKQLFSNAIWFIKNRLNCPKTSKSLIFSTRNVSPSFHKTFRVILFKYNMWNSDLIHAHTFLWELEGIHPASKHSRNLFLWKTTYTLFLEYLSKEFTYNILENLSEDFF